eukprot:CAMPEP_0172447950 /NCGR_PEP_ID=MMETSP1065-20121228/7079_1 /TAXON_ID=265537 /ORGANISM="Amphiprora paludosa, Strain CCMP125" /LENGTH=973 /DNA_ID=CAMNT_0013199323 /DNA_START=426 /DNA_END=3348 /DNA_ORIENTATION=-
MISYENGDGQQGPPPGRGGDLHQGPPRGGGNGPMDDRMRMDDRKFGRNGPDRGSAYFPGSKPRANNAPQSLDHFKRGYKERKDMRDREEVFLLQHQQGPRGGGSGRHVKDWRRHEQLPDSMRKSDQPFILQGFNVTEWIERNANPHANVEAALGEAYQNYREAFQSGKAMTALIAAAARRRLIRLAQTCWRFMDKAGLEKNVFHYNAMISVTEKDKNLRAALDLLKEMDERGIEKNEITYSSAISACEKTGQWRVAIDLLDRMEREGSARSTIAYNAAISACEKGMVPTRACEVFQRMKRFGIEPSVVSYSALISAAEKGGQWKLALKILEDMKMAGFTGNVVAYSAAISAVAKGQQWEIALRLFREIQSCGGSPSIITYNATMTALEKGMQWERALGLFEEMKMKNLPITVVSYGSAISACDKGLQYRQCLEYLDEMTEMGIEKNVIIFGAAMSCMEKCCRPDISFQLMDRMRLEMVAPNVHIFNSVISACARCNMWEKGHQLFLEMDNSGVKKDVVTYNAVLDAVASQIQLGRELFREGVQKGYYAQVSRLGKQWFELDLHFLSLGGGEIALSWWFEECLTPFLEDTSKLEPIHTISIVTGYGKTRTRGRRQGNDGMKKRVQAMLNFMGVKEMAEDNAGRVRVDKAALVEHAKKLSRANKFDLEGYTNWKETETTANQVPDVPQKIRARFKPQNPGASGPPFTRIETEHTSPEYLLEYQRETAEQMAADEKALLESPRQEGWHGRERGGPYRGGGPPQRFGDGGGRGGRSHDGSPRWGGPGRGNDDRRSWNNDRSGDRFNNNFNDRGGNGRYGDDNSRFERRRGSQDHYYGPSGTGGGVGGGGAPPAAAAPAGGAPGESDGSRPRGSDYYGPPGDPNRPNDAGGRGPPQSHGNFEEQRNFHDNRAAPTNNGPPSGSRPVDLQQQPEAGESAAQRKRGYEDVAATSQGVNDGGRGYSLEPAATRPRIKEEQG